MISISYAVLGEILPRTKYNNIGHTPPVNPYPLSNRSPDIRGPQRHTAAPRRPERSLRLISSLPGGGAEGGKPRPNYAQ